MRNQIVILVATILFSCSGAIAQEQWTLEACIQTALENSLEIEQAIYKPNGVAWSEINVKQAQHNRYPSLSASSDLGLNFGRSINPVTNLFETQSILSNGFGLNSSVVLFNGFRIANSLRQAKVDLAASNEDVNQLKRDVALAVANNYLGVLFADENLAIAQSQLEVSTEQLAFTNKLIKAGSRPANEALDVEAQIATNEQAVITAENSKTIALLNLKQQLRLENNVEIEVVKPSEIEVYSDVDVLTVEEVYSQAYQNQPSVRSAELNLKSAELGEKIAKAGLIPSLGAGGAVKSNYSRLPDPIPNDAYSTQLDNNLSYGVGVSLNIPIYENYANQLNLQKAKLGILSQKNIIAQVENALMVTVQQALTDAKAAKRKLTAPEKSVAAQLAAMDNAQKRYELGSINSFEYVTIQNNAAQAQLNAVLAKYEYLFATKVLDFYMGKPLSLD